MIDNFSPRQTIRKKPVRSAGGVVAGQHGGAAQVGADILARGGNAIDAAIAVSLALGVLEPWMSGIGGGGLMVVQAPDGETKVIDFGMAAPAGLDPGDYPVAEGTSSDLFAWPAVEGQRNLMGAGAIAIPGVVAGLGLAHERYGSRPWAELVAPAIELARRGLAVDWYATLMIAQAARHLAGHPASAELFLPGGWPPAIPITAEGETRLPMPKLARSLETLRDDGPRAFYEGPLAESIAADIAAAGGCLDRSDLRDHGARLQEPLTIDYRGATLWATPELSAGPTLAETLAQCAFSPAAAPDGEFYQAIGGALGEAFERRLAVMGDTDDGRSPACTSHFTVVDRDGMIVSLTQTLLSIFGSMIVLPQSGILMNNGIFWFDPRPGGPNSLAAGKRCLSNMCPVVGVRSDGASFGLGASGGRRIVGAVAQVVSFLTDFGMDLETALHQPRIDVSGAGVMLADKALDGDILARLGEDNTVIGKKRTATPSWFANVSAILRRDGINQGGSEPALPWADAVAEERP